MAAEIHENLDCQAVILKWPLAVCRKANMRFGVFWTVTNGDKPEKFLGRGATPARAWSDAKKRMEEDL